MVMAIQPATSTTSTLQEPMRDRRAVCSPQTEAVGSDSKVGGVRRKSRDSEHAEFALMLGAMLTNHGSVGEASPTACGTVAEEDNDPAAVAVPDINAAANSDAKASLLTKITSPSILRRLSADSRSPDIQDQSIPGAQVPTTQVPTTQVPITQVPITQVPITQVPITQV
ncbi:MAG TPA: hypothetical protein PLY87_05760, partial [Planctomycetaceae bacterium]|nr:hypothetical protein [Planctomycetaceae bacterium]HQZ64558.1 hypothetical protein [Planctomycetaceae bacterium]